MSFLFNDSFKKTIREEITSKSKKELEKALYSIKENMFYGQEMLGIGSWTYFTKNGETFLSGGIYNIFETNYEDLKENLESLNPYFHPDDQVGVLGKMEDLLKGRDYDIEYRIITKSGLIKFLHEKTKTIYDEDGIAIKIFGVIQDITNEKLMEYDLKSIYNYIDKYEVVEGLGQWNYDIIKDEYYLSEEVYNMHDITPSEFRNNYKNFLKVVHIDDHSNLEDVRRNALNGKPFKVEYRILKKDGFVKYLAVIGKPFFNEEGQVILLSGTVQDITEKKELSIAIEQREKEIYNLEKRHQNIIKESKDGFKIIDSKGIIKHSSLSVGKIIGYSSEEIINTNIYEIFKNEELKTIKKMVGQVIKDSGKTIESTVPFTTKNGRQIYLEIYMTNLIDEPSTKGIVVNFRDVTERMKTQKQLIYDANYDKFTGLKNRKKFLEDLKKVNTKAKLQGDKYALIMIDIHGLKHINFSLGDNMENRLVLKAVDRLKKTLTDQSDISKYSKDVYVIVSKGKTVEDFKELAEKIIDLFSKPIKVNAYEFLLNINMGICIFPKEKKDRLPLINSVKIALIKAKKQGENSYMFYYPELNIDNYKNIVFRNDLFYAIRKGQLEVYYQPIVAIRSNEIISAEALIRWNHPDWGLVSPGEFIQIAEESELIIDIGKWVLREVCMSYKRWISKQLPPIKVNVNFSGIQFFEIDFVKNIKEIIEEFKLKPDFLIMEITENILLQNKDKVVEDIKNIRSMGIEIALDDFGTGFSSLSYLSSLNIDIIKLDRSFIKNLPLDRVGSVITRATIKLAEELEIQFVAEGIENWDQLSYLKGLNCEFGQGYFYSKPKPIEEFEKLLFNKKCKPTFPHMNME